MKMHLNLRLKYSVVLVTRLGMHPGIPWLPFVIKTTSNSSKTTKLYKHPPLVQWPIRVRVVDTFYLRKIATGFQIIH